VTSDLTTEAQRTQGVIDKGEVVEAGPQRSEPAGMKPAGLLLRALAGALVGAGVIALILVVGPLLFRSSGSAAPTAPEEEPKVGSIAPNFELEVVGTGERLSLKSLRGKAVWINFWATWCPPCREEMPEMQGLYEQHRAQGLEIVAVDVQEPLEKVVEFAQELGLTFPIVLDRDGSVVDRYYVSGLPSHFFVDREGVIQAIHMGGLKTLGGRRAPVEEYLEKILGP
jgi:thiol-disulfide isomerase/thioredoxin